MSQFLVRSCIAGILVGIIAPGAFSAPVRDNEKIKARNGTRLLQTIKRNMPGEYEVMRPALTGSSPDKQFIAAMQVATDKAMRVAPVGLLRRYYKVKTVIYAELYAHDPAGAFEFVSARRPIKFDNLKLETNQEVVDILCAMVEAYPTHKGFPYNAQEGGKALEAAAKHMSRTEVDLILTDVNQVRDKKAYVAATIHLCQSLLSLPDAQSVQGFRMIFPDPRP